MKRLWGSPQSFLNKGRVEKYISSGTAAGESNSKPLGIC